MTPTCQARLARVLRHVEENPDGDLSVAALGGVAALSPHHFHRLFSGLLGIGVHRYVQLARLKRACWRLAYRPAVPVLEIALDAGYEGPEAFARAFRRHLGQSPSGFRRAPDWAAWQAAFDTFGKIRREHMVPGFEDARVEIREVPDIPVAVLAHRGDPALLGDSIRRFIAWRKAAGLPPRLSATYNLLYGDPEDTPPQEFRLDLCAATDRPVAPNDAGVEAGTIPGGRCAVLRHAGSDDGLGAALRFLYGTWLPASGEEPRDCPPYLQRIAFFPDVPEHAAVTDIFLPLR